MHILFLSHCGFLVDTGAHLLVFDYCPRRQARLAEPLLTRALQSQKPALFFVSHAHKDHYDPQIFTFPARRFLLSSDIPPVPGATSVAPERVYEFPECRVQTFSSTDQGVAFLVHIDGTTIYHAGDLNWWNWPGEPDPWNPDMERTFLKQAQRLCQIPIDLAFLTADPRQKGAWLMGFDYLMRCGKIRHAVPMHFWNQSSAPQRVLQASCTEPYRDRIIPLARCGDGADL